MSTGARRDGGFRFGTGTGTWAPVEGAGVPASARGRRTRGALVVAAREVFEDKGFNATRMGDIAVAAGVSHGTVYTWFDSKEAVLRAVVEGIVVEVYAALAIGDDVRDPVQRLHEANRLYLEAYERHARMLTVVEQVAADDHRYREALAGLRRDHVGRVTRDIERLQRAGLAANDLDAPIAASALCAMVEGFGRHWYGNGEQHQTPGDAAAAVETLTQIWAGGIGLRRASIVDEPQHHIGVRQ